MNQDHRKQSIRTIIQIKRVWLAVRFNCKLSFIIRNQLSEKVAEIDNTYNLCRGECLVNETIYFELPQEVLTNRCKKLKLIVMMISANGMVPAGFVNFNTHTRSPYEQFQAILPLERCEDTRAQIKFMHMYEFCSKITIENSFINQHLNRQDLPLYENETPFSKIGKKSSHSASRENLSARKYRYKETQIVSNNQRLNFSRPLVSPRTLTKNFEGLNSQKSIKISTFQRGYEDDKITEEKEPLDSSINPLSKEQLMKEHQQYWLEIIRLEEEVEHLKEENAKVSQQNRSLKGEAETLKEYYEGHQEKIHAFLGEIQENSQTIKRLQEKIEHQSHTIAKKQELIRQLQEHAHKQDDFDEIMKVFAHEKSIAAHQHEILTEKVLFLQGEVRKLSQQNLELKENLSTYTDKNYFLSNNNEAQRHIIIELEKKLLQECKKVNMYATFQQEKQSLIQELHILRESSLKDQEKLQGVVRLLQSQVQQKESISLQKSQKEELAMIALFKHEESMNELQMLKKAYDNIMDCSSIDQSKLRIFERQLQISSKEKDDLQSQVRRREYEIKELREQNEELSQENKMLKIKLIEYEANIAGKTSTIDELRNHLQSESNEKQQQAEKFLSIERQFQQLASQLSKEVEEKNRMAIILTTLEDNSKNVENQLNHYMKSHQDFVKKHSQLKRQLQSKEKNHQEERSQLQLQIELKQQQLTEMIEKASNLQMDLQSALNVIEEHNRSKNTVRDQYQDSYNQSMTALTLKNGKLQNQLQEANQEIQKSKLANQLLSQKLQVKDNEITELKVFTHNKLQENLKLIKERQELKKQLSIQEAKIIKAKESLQAANRENQVKIQQLKSQLQFVTEILQRERQEKSDIEKQIDHLEKSQLPRIYEVGQLKQESFDSKQEEVNLEIESKVISSQENIKEERTEGNNKKKKKKR